MHGGIGFLTAGLGGGAGAAFSSALIPTIGENIASMNLPPVVRDALTTVAATTLGSIGGAPGAAAAFNQAANNLVTHSPFGNVRTAMALENSRLSKECEPNCTQQDYRRIDQQVAQLGRAANLAEISKRNTLTPEQAKQMAQTMLDLVPIYGNMESVAQVISGHSSLTGEEISRLWAAVGILPAGGILKKIVPPSAKVIEKKFKEIGAAPEQALTSKATSKITPIQKNDNWNTFVNNEKHIQLKAKSLRRVETVIQETLTGKNNFTSSTILTTDEALSAGQKYLGEKYQEIGKNGSGVFHSADGTREFRIDSGSLEGAHRPSIPHVHFGLKDLKSGK